MYILNLIYSFYRIYTDSGRAQRPLFIVENNNLKFKKSDLERMKIDDENDKKDDENVRNVMTFDDAVERGLIEFLDVEEEEVSMIAMMIDDLKDRSDYCYTYTHCEIHPSMILGVCASIIPFPDHNQVNFIYFSFIYVNIKLNNIVSS